MASGSLVGGNGDGSRENNRWSENKVYTRKAYKGPKKISQTASQSLAAEDVSSSQQQLLARFDAVSDDSSSLNLRPVSVPNNRDPPSGNSSVRPVFPMLENRVTISLSSRSKLEVRELRRKLANDLDRVRNLVKRLEAKELQISGYSGGGYSQSQLSANNAIGNGGAKRVSSEVASVGLHSQESKPLHPLSISVVENSQGLSDVVEKEKRTPKANQYYRNSEFVLGKEKFPPPGSNKKSKSSGGKKHGGRMGEGEYGFGMDKYSSLMFKNCSSLLAKLTKHKHGWVFNTPVDVKGLGLHDYYTIIKHPMDLGTVKSRLNKNWYKSPREFAEDVRLTFRNAMTYNPKGQDVYIMADELSKIFEERWAVIQDYNRDSSFGLDYEANLPTPMSRKVPPYPPTEMRTLERSESLTQPINSRVKPSIVTPSVRTPAPKKPKAKDPNKRDMTYEEKQRLSMNLQSLPPEKLDNIVQIIKKRNSSLFQHDDEIEVDIDSVDTETLWELDRFVTNYKKSLSKIKRRAELASQARAEAEHNVQEKNPAPAVVEAPTATEKDVGNAPPSSPVEVEKQGNNASRSSTSSSSSSDSGSSSSESDSESSSAFGSDTAHSPKS